MRNKSLILLTAVLSMVLFGCPPKSETAGGTATTANGGDILVGEYGSLTGPQATFGQSTLNASGGQIVGKQSYSNGDSDFRSQLTAIRTASPEVIFVPGYYTDVGQIASQARDLGVKAPLVGGDGWESPKLLEIGGKALEGCFYANHYFSDDPTPIVHDFVEKYKQRYKAKPDALAALGYDAARVLA